MHNDTKRQIDAAKIAAAGDPMGLEELRDAVARLSRLREEELASGRPSRWCFCAESLEKALEGTLSRYELLRDRYALLKRSNSQLADEVEWLRDQCDDLFFAHKETPKADSGQSARRYSDRWPK